MPQNGNTSTDWPPEGYDAPVEYETDQRQVLVIAVVTTVTLFWPTWGAISAGGVKAVLALFDSGFAFGSPVIGAFVVAILAFGVSIGVVTPIHEALHYLPGVLFNLNPDVGLQSGFIPSPFVVHHTTGITVSQNLVTMLLPVTVISILSAVVMWVSSGITAGLAAFLLLSNAVASAQDLSHAIRLLRLPRGTLFANFDQKNEYRTEYSTPDSEDL